MAGLAIPLGGLLTSMRPLRAYAIDIAGSMAGIVAFTAPVGRRHLAADLVRDRRDPALAARPGRRPEPALARDGHLDGRRAGDRARRGDPRRRLVALLPAARVPGRRRQRARRERRAAPGDAARRPVEGLVLRADLPLVPGSPLRAGPHRGRRQRHRHRAPAVARRGLHRRGRDRPGHPGDRRPRPSRPAVLGPAGPSLRRRRPGVRAQRDRHVRPGHLRAAGFAHAREHVGEPAPRVVPVHEPGVRERARPPGPGRDLRPVQLLPRAVAGPEDGRHAPEQLRHARRSSGSTRSSATPPRPSPTAPASPRSPGPRRPATTSTG